MLYILFFNHYYHAVLILFTFYLSVCMWKLGKNRHPSSPYPIVMDWVILIIKVNGLEIIGFLEGSLGKDPLKKSTNE